MSSNINNILDTNYYHIFYKNKELKQLKQKTLPKLEKIIKNKVIAPKTNKKVYIISLKINLNSDKRKLIISCGQYTITPKLILAKSYDDDSFNIVYSSDELKKYKFKLSHIKKIIKKITNEELDIETQFINITNILN